MLAHGMRCRGGEHVVIVTHLMLFAEDFNVVFNRLLNRNLVIR